MNRAMETVDKYSRVACWNFCKNQKYRKEILILDASLRNFFLVNLPVDPHKNITLIQVQLKHLAERLERIMARNRNTSRRTFNRS
ncbi:hypothetical protein DITRI_Ditri18aG0096100 [Diplodiscus trichospermus]